VALNAKTQLMHCWSPFRPVAVRGFFIALCCTMGNAGTIAQGEPQAETSLVSKPTLDKDDRILVFAPHPDDETLGCAGVIQEAVAMKLPVRIVWLTYGDNNEWSFMLYRKRFVLMPEAVRQMGEVRHSEAVAAAKVLGVGPDQLAFLGYPDFGTLTIWYRHWNDQPPLESMLTKVNKVPYANAFRPGASYKGEDILRDIETNLREFKPTKVFISHPSDHNVDHQALYLFTRVALWDLADEICPEVYPYLVHFAHWPLPEGLHTTRPILPPAALAGAVDWSTVPLSTEQVHVKEKALHAHRSQLDSSKTYLNSFVRANELFGDFPPVIASVIQTNNQLLTGHRQRFPLLKEQLNDEERTNFVGIEKMSVARENDDLVVTVRLSKHLFGGVSASIFTFGYRNDEPFEQMPKLRINVGELRHEVLDQDRKLPKNAVQIHHRGQELTLHIPMKVLGDPQRVLTCVHTYYLDVDPLDWAEWRVVEIAPSQQATATAEETLRQKVE
jgi:LmbE family N-acetylglucosaminyl deacetylase